MSNIIDLIESEGIRKDIPDFQPGDTVMIVPTHRGLNDLRDILA